LAGIGVQGAKGASGATGEKGMAGIHAPSVFPTAFPTASPTTSPTSLEFTNINQGVMQTVVTDIKDALAIWSDTWDPFQSLTYFPTPSQYNYHATPEWGQGGRNTAMCVNGGGGSFTVNAPTHVVIGCYSPRSSACANPGSVSAYSTNVEYDDVSKTASTNPHHNGFLQYESAGFKFLTVNVDVGYHKICCGVGSHRDLRDCGGRRHAAASGLFIPKTEGSGQY
jgi:hypothetical protein